MISKSRIKSTLSAHVQLSTMTTNVLKVEMYFLDVVEHADFRASLECPVVDRRGSSEINIPY